MAKLSLYQLSIELGIHWRLRFAFGILFALVLTLCVEALYAEHAINATLQRYDTNVLPSLRTIHAVMQGVGATRLTETQHVMVSSPGELRELESRLSQQRARVQSNLADYRPLIADDDDRSDYAKVQDRIGAYFQLQDQVIANSASDSSAAARQVATRLLLEGSRQAFYGVKDSIAAWERRSQDRSHALAAQSEERYTHGIRKLVWTICLFAVYCAWAVGQLIAPIIRPLALAIDMAKAVTRGDLTRRDDLGGTDQMSKLISTLSSMSAHLSGLIADVLGSAQAVGLTAGEIAQSNEELSSRTQQQAASLEETAASMEEITSLGRNNSDNAANAAKLAQQARELAESGGNVVAQAVSAMSAINEGSARISNIIGVIDEIAFQTNLLALNAAVEAARAGEQGRGFAVVASEVRALAGRSAAAAKEIKALITDSAGKVRAGTELVDRSGQALSQILASVREMTSLIKEIANSSHEQAAGVQRINESILHLDGATQQNAALVEESSAASRTLQTQAETLSRRASHFKVDNAPALLARQA
jgi:methyl-accepting chemotaxis protein